MRVKCFIIPVLLVSLKAFPQSELTTATLTAKLDRIRAGNGLERHFADLYFITTVKADDYINLLPPAEQELMNRLSKNFADYFFRAIDAGHTGEDMPGEWKNYFNGDHLSPLQMKLMGVNAHVNGDIWQAMLKSFSLEEIKMLKPVYKKYSKAIDKIYDWLFEFAITTNKKMKTVHSLTLGLDKVYGKMIFNRWRNRQLRLAIASFKHPKRFQRLKSRVNNKREKIDKVIIHALHLHAAK